MTFRLPALGRLVRLLPLIAVLSPVSAGAATLGWQAVPPPVISGTGWSFDEPWSGLMLLGDDAAVSTPPAPETGLSVVVPFADPFAMLGAVFVTTGDGTEFLSGDLEDAGYVVGPGEDVIELLFGNLTGTAAGHFGAHALLQMYGEFGDDPFGTGFGGLEDPVATRFTIAPASPPAVVPVGPALAFLPAAVAMLGAIRRRRPVRSGRPGPA